MKNEDKEMAIFLIIAGVIMINFYLLPVLSSPISTNANTEIISEQEIIGGKLMDVNKVRYNFDWGHGDFSLYKGVPYINHTVEHTYYSAQEKKNVTKYWNYTMHNYTIPINNVSTFYDGEKFKILGFDEPEFITINKTKIPKLNKYRYILNSTEDMIHLYKEVINETTGEKIYNYPIVYNYHHSPEMEIEIAKKERSLINKIPITKTNQEFRHIYNFKDICKHNYSDCQWAWRNDSLVIDFYSYGNIDPVGTPTHICATLSGAYYLDDDITTTGDCFVLAQHLTSLDLNGYFIDGDDGANDYGIHGSGDYVLQKVDDTAGGGYIQDFGRGIFAGSSNFITRNINFISNYYGLYTDGKPGAYDNLTFTDSEGYSIRTSRENVYYNITIRSPNLGGIFVTNGFYNTFELFDIDGDSDSNINIYIVDSNRTEFRNGKVYDSVVRNLYIFSDSARADKNLFQNVDMSDGLVYIESKIGISNLTFNNVTSKKIDMKSTGGKAQLILMNVSLDN